MVQIHPELVKANAMTYDEYLSNVSDGHKEQWKDNVETMKSFQLRDEMLDFLKLPSVPLNIIIFSKEWCPECRTALSILDKFSRENRSIKLQVIDRDQVPELYSLYMPNDDERVPVVLFTSEDYYLVTMWIERPAKKFMLIHRIMAEMKEQGKDKVFEKFSETFIENDEALMQATMEELFSELARTIGCLNYSTRLLQ